MCTFSHVRGHTHPLIDSKFEKRNTDIKSSSVLYSTRMEVLMTKQPSTY